MKRWIISLIVLFVLIFVGFWSFKKFNFNQKYSIGQRIDSLNNVVVFYNGGVDNISGRNVVDGYNIGLKYQCVEFVKRYYYEYLNHKMPESYGHAKDFYNNKFKDGEKNTQRNLMQFTNPSKTQPKINDIIVFDGTAFNKYGHVAIISSVTDDEIEIIQQNSGPFGETREKFALENKDEKWEIKNKRVLGWLRKN